MSKILYFDCFAGASGDMILGALIDAGFPLDELRHALGSLIVEDVRLETERVDRSGIAATSFHVVTGEIIKTKDSYKDKIHTSNNTVKPLHDHKHEHLEINGEHHHRGLSEICRMIEDSSLSSSAKTRARHLFNRLATTEAEIHQQSVEDIHFHEVGAVDSIIDICGVVFGMEWMGIDKVVSSPLNVGSGTVTCAHGVMPVPAPATAKLIEGFPVYSSGIEAELLTPTGALLVTDYASNYGPMPAMRVKQIGYGAGDRNLSGTPNVLRVVIGDDSESTSLQRVVVIETEIDDMNPQIFGALMDRLYESGALDVFYSPIQMKKNRPGTLVSILAFPEHREAISNVLFLETTTLGVRFQEVNRECLDREQVIIKTPLGSIRFKLARRDGLVVNFSPEFDDCVRVAKEKGLSVKEVQAVSTKAYLDTRRSTEKS